MYLREKLDELKLLKQKIAELEFYICNSNTNKKDDLVKAVLSYIEDVQNIKLILNKVNNQSLVHVGTSKIDTNTAIIIRNTLNTKIDLISSIIKNDTALDILTLVEQRDALIEEYNAINKAIRLVDWSVQID